jgi:hypothetical protein
MIESTLREMLGEPQPSTAGTVPKEVYMLT